MAFHDIGYSRFGDHDFTAEPNDCAACVADRQAKDAIAQGVEEVEAFANHLTPRHQLTLRQLPGNVTVAACTCGAWVQAPLHAEFWGGDATVGHGVHVHLAQLGDDAARNHMAALADVFAKTDAALRRMLAAGAVED